LPAFRCSLGGSDRNRNGAARVAVADRAAGSAAANSPFLPTIAAYLALSANLSQLLLNRLPIVAIPTTKLKNTDEPSQGGGTVLATG
jgi:hypothetical protein